MEVLIMQARVQPRPANWPLIATVWLLTLLPWLLPYGSTSSLLLSVLCTLASNTLALVLLFSSARADRLNGFGRLVLQFFTLVIGVVILLRSGVSLNSLFQAMTHSRS